MKPEAHPVIMASFSGWSRADSICGEANESEKLKQQVSARGDNAVTN